MTHPAKKPVYLAIGHLTVRISKRKARRKLDAIGIFPTVLVGGVFAAAVISGCGRGWLTPQGD